MREVAATVRLWRDPATLKVDLNDPAAVAAYVAEGVAHSLLVVLDGGTALAVAHPVAVFEVDDQGRPLPDSDLGGGLHEDLYEFLND
jgi:hypothetical protein